MRFNILKSKGNATVPDYIQVRDADMNIIAYFKSDNIDKGLDELKLKGDARDSLRAVLPTLAYGRMTAVEI
jgi:hypothetical protein